jgi:hypothetical protein
MHLPTVAGARRRAPRALLAAAAVAITALPAAAQAAEVSSIGTEIVVQERSGRIAEINRVTAESLPSGELRLVDQAPLVSKASSCLQVTEFEVRCIRPLTAPITKLTVRTGGRDDRFRMFGSLPVRYEGGTGDDAYVGGGRPGTPTRVDFSGGGDPGDLADYSLASEGIDVRREGLANDGRETLGDGDNIREDVTLVRGTRLADRLIGDGAYEVFEPLDGDDVILGGRGLTVVEMAPAKDGADRVLGGSETLVSYSRRTNAIRAAVDQGGADDGEAGEGDELKNVGVIGGHGNDTMLAPDQLPNGGGVFFDGGPGDDGLAGTLTGDRLKGGPGKDLLTARAGDDVLISNDSDPVDTLFCSSGNDTAAADAVEAIVRDCETRTLVGTLRVAPKTASANADKPVHLRLSWRHPVGWRKLRVIELRLTRDGFPVGEITIRPRGERITAGGAVALAREHTRVAHKGKTVTARLAVRVDASLAGQALEAEVEATDTRGRRQLEPNAGTFRVAQ